MPTATFASRLLRFLLRLMIAGAQILALLLLIAVAGAFYVFQRYGQHLPDPALIAVRRPSETTLIYARDGTTLLYALDDPDGGQRTVVPFDRIPRTLKDATVAVEDAGFYQNPGVDLWAIGRALYQNYRSGEIVSGGSTITQQLVRNVLLSPEERTNPSYERKLREAILAYQASQQYSKDQILGIYLNEVPYGNRALGVQAAARAYFGKDVWQLNAAEQTLIAGLPQSPTILDPFTNFAGAKARQRIVLDQMVRHGYLVAAQAETIFATDTKLTPQTRPIVAPHFAFYVKQLLEERYGPDALLRGGLRVITTIDMAWQAEAERIARERLADLADRNATNTAVVILSPDNEILAMVGSADYSSTAIDGQVNVALARRQPGSALKPVVYAAALRSGWTPATVIWDGPTDFPTPGGEPYAPMNYDNSWHGPQRLRMALANSFNIPAVKALEHVGVDQFVELAGQMGITTFDDPSRFGLAMALGSNEVRLLDLTNVYATLRNAGRARPTVAVLRVGNARGEVLERSAPNAGRQTLGEHGEQIAFLLTDILSDNGARRLMFGPNNIMELADGRPAAVKTGTSNTYRDSWAVGYTPDVVVGVWVGNSSGEPMAEVAGANGAGTIWRALMDRYHEGCPIRPFATPPGIESRPICLDTGGLASDACPRRADEWFVSGSAPQAPDVTSASVRVGGGGTCLATAATPPDQVTTMTYPVYPPDFKDWAASSGAPQPPTEPCAAPVRADPNAARLDVPGSISGPQVYLNGAASGAYSLSYGLGVSPASWTTITSGEAAAEGLLGLWRLDGVRPGGYTLRLQVTTESGAIAEARRSVMVR